MVASLVEGSTVLENSDVLLGGLETDDPTALEGAIVDGSTMLVRLAVLLNRTYEDDSKVLKGSVAVEAVRLLVCISVVPEFIVYG